MSSLSGRLLLLTIGFVMLAEVLIFMPSVARFRVDYLEERIVRAHIAALNAMETGERRIDPGFAEDMLKSAEVLNVIVIRGGPRELVLASPIPPASEVSVYDLRNAGFFELMYDGLATLFGDKDGIIRVIAVPDMVEDRVLEVTLSAGPLITEMRDYGWRILQLSLVISGITAVLVFVCVRAVVVRPMTEVIDNMTEFANDPENPELEIKPRSGLGEVAEAERALARMQKQLRRALKNKTRLAALGEAVAKISHDLRNILASTQLLADRLDRSRDPLVARVAPKLLGSLDRAIRLCQSSLDFGRAEEAPPEIREVALASLAAEVAEGIALGPDTTPVAARIEIPDGLTVPADPEQLYRVLSNLMRNAREAMEAAGKGTHICISAAPNGGGAAEITVSDDGPGIPAKAREHLFQPFRGSARRGGTGLGLAIAHELIRAHGGELSLLSSTTEGTRFVIRLPAARKAAA